MLEQPQRPPDFIDRRTVNELSADEFDAHIERIRVERMKAHKLYLKAEEDKRLIADAKARETLAKQYEMLGKDIGSLDKVINRMSERFVKVQALRLQLGIDV